MTPRGRVRLPPGEALVAFTVRLRPEEVERLRVLRVGRESLAATIRRVLREGMRIAQ